MKKILSILLVVIMAISCFALVGCGGDATFEGNYEEATATDVQNFANSVDAADGDTDIDIEDGYEINMEVKNMIQTTPMGTAVADLDMTFRVKSELGNMKVEGTAKGKTKYNAGVYSGMEIDANGKVYWTGGYLYSNESDTIRYQGQTQPQEYKQKIQMEDFDTYLNTYAQNFDGLDFSELVEMAVAVGDKMGLGISQDENGTKIKFSIPVNNGVSGEMIFVFDNNYNLTSLKYDVTIGNTEDAMTIVATYKPYSGNVTLPNDLDTYQLVSPY